MNFWMVRLIRKVSKSIYEPGCFPGTDVAPGGILLAAMR